MTPADRRVNRRLTIDSDVRLEIEFLLGDAVWRARVLDLSECAIRAEYPTDAPFIPAGQWLAHVVVHRPDADPLALRVLTVADISREHGRTLRLTTADEQTRAGLWLTMDSLRTGELGPSRGDEKVRRRVRSVPQRGVYTEDARLERLAYLRRQTGSALTSFEFTTLEPDRLLGNIENLIGGVEIPIGVAGPLLFTGEKARGLVFAPMATTEGALVSSVTRGAIAISRGGGVTTRVVRRQMMRVPLFVFSEMRGAYRFCNWVRDHVAEIRHQTRQISRHAVLLTVDPELRGNMVTVSFVYDTGDAAGQNMSTSCTWHACQWLMQQMKHFDDIRIERFFIESGVSGDKKVSFQSFISGRGTRVTAECLLSRSVVEDVLKVTPEELVHGYELASAFGVQSGTVGWNINVANVVAAVFAATGQDIACVHESSVALLYLRNDAEGVYASLVLPSLVIGTVGGGTHLPRQSELLDMMGCRGSDKVSRLAEIIAGFSLALDLSTLAAIAGGQFVAAHERLGRNRPIQSFTTQDLIPDFFTPGLQQALGDPHVRVIGVTLDEPMDSGNSIITELTAGRIEKLVGLIPAHLTLDRDRGPDAQTLDVVVKVKPLDTEVILMTHRLAAMCGGHLAVSHARFKDRLGFNGCHRRELAVYEQDDGRFRAHTPVVYGTHRNETREAFVLVLEDLRGLELLNSVNSPAAWTDEHLEAAIDGLASLHAIWYGREAALIETGWLGRVLTTRDMVEMQPLWRDLAVHAAKEFPEWFDAADLATHQHLIETIPAWWPLLDAGPRTLIHNDCNPRNLAFRRDQSGLRLVAYDWELATLGLPQRDLAELLCHVLNADTPRATLDRWIDLHRLQLARKTGTTIPADDWHSGFRASVFNLAVSRLALSIAAHTFRHYPFMERVHKTAHHMMALMA